MPLMSPVLDGSRMVLDSLARLEKADTYCSATLSEAAAFPFCTKKSVEKKTWKPLMEFIGPTSDE